MSQDNTPETTEISNQVEEFLSVWFEVRQQIQNLNTKRSRQEDLSVTQFMVLALLENAPEANPPTISSLATHLNLDPTTVLRSVDSLENRNLVERRRDKKDRRLVFIGLTEAGRQTQKQSYSGFKERLAIIFNLMSEEGREALIKGFKEFSVAAQTPTDHQT